MSLLIKPNVFISYKRNHEATLEAVKIIESALYGAGFTIWRDIIIPAGAIWSNELYTWLIECSAAVALIGKDAANSEWCRREWWFLRERHRTSGLPLVPVCLDGSRDSAGILDDFQAVGLPVFMKGDVLSKLRGQALVRSSAQNYLSAHHAWLRWQFYDARVLGREQFSLSDIYVETDCGGLSWGDIVGEGSTPDPFRDDITGGGRHNLLNTVLEIISAPEFRDLIVVQGPPGCGKSAFTLRLANELLSLDLHPVLVRFRDFRLNTFQTADELIEDALRIGPVDEEPPRPIEQLITNVTLSETVRLKGCVLSKFVFILDGWDEVSLTGSASYQARLQSWLPRIREFFVGRAGPPVRLILTGRPSAEVSTSGILKRETQVLTVRQMTPPALRGYAASINEALGHPRMNGPGSDWKLEIDRLGPVFERYERWFALGVDRDSQTSGIEVVGNPLLAFLTFRTLAEWAGDPSELINEPTALYKVLIDLTVKHAGKGQDEGLEDSVHRGGHRLRHLLHRVACVISVLGREAVSFTELSHRLQDDEALNKWYSADYLRNAIDDATKQSALHELVVNFYFKSGNTGIGCEFLHKSFREYLFAEAIVTTIEHFAAQASGPLDGLRLEYWQDFPEETPQYDASRALSHLLSAQWLTAEVCDHINWLLKREIKAAPERWVWLRDLILDVYIWWAEGAHLRSQPKRQRGVRQWKAPFVNELSEHALPYDPDEAAIPMRATSLDGRLGDALMQITATIHAELANAPRSPDPSNGLRARYRRIGTKVSFAPGSGGFFDSILSRINAARWRRNGPFPSAARLPGLDLTNIRVSAHGLGRSNLMQGPNSPHPMNLNLSGANLTGANLARADLREYRFSDAILRFADFSEACLISAVFEGADLRDANFAGADLSGANLASANLAGANLLGANLTNACLTKAIMDGACLIDANLSGADLRRS